MSLEVNPGYETLIEFGVVSRSARPNKARTAIITCIGCKLNSSPENEGRIYGSEVARCGAVEQSFVSTTLRRLERAGVLEADGCHDQGRREPLYYSIAHTAVGEAFKESVLPPLTCPLRAAK